MRISRLPTLALALASAEAYSRCYTSYGTESISPVSTSGETFARTVTATSTATSGAIVTVTPTPDSTTLIELSTSTVEVKGNQQTETLTTTVTRFSTENTYSVYTVTTTVPATLAITQADTITTAPTSAGFTPIQSQISVQGYTPAKRAKREEKGSGSWNYWHGPAQYPTSVACRTWVEVVSTSIVTVAGSSTSTTTAWRETSTITITSTTTVTSAAAPPNATITSTEYAYPTTTVPVTYGYTSTVTSTLTTTSTLPNATAYAACAPSNLLTTINSLVIVSIQPFYGRDTTATSSAVDCCTQCQALGSKCGGFAYNPANPDRSVFETCTLFRPDANTACNATASAGAIYVADGDDPVVLPERYTVGNSGCGFIGLYDTVNLDR